MSNFPPIENCKWFDFSTFGQPNIDTNTYGGGAITRLLTQGISVIGQTGVYVSIIIIAVGVFCLIFNFRKPLKWGLIGFGACSILSLLSL